MEDVFGVSGPLGLPQGKTGKPAAHTEFVIDGKSPDGRLSLANATKSATSPFTTEPPPIRRLLAAAQHEEGQEPHGSTGGAASEWLSLLCCCCCAEALKKWSGRMPAAYKASATYQQLSTSDTELGEL